MLIFELLFIFGFLGVVAMVLTGLGHHGGAALRAGHIGGIFGHGGSHALGAGHSHPGTHIHGGHASAGAHGRGAASGEGDTVAHPSPTANQSAANSHMPVVHAEPQLAGAEVPFILTVLPSPLDVFAICAGAGIAGATCFKLFGIPAIYLIALGGGVIFDLLIRQILSFALRFASKPSEGLEGMVATSAEAITRFDERGMGLVKVCMEGQLVQLLAKLEPSELASGVNIHKGDQVVLLEVDPKKNTCRVTRELSV